jgi:hypothetical protein
MSRELTGFYIASFGDHRDIVDNVEKIRACLSSNTAIEFHCFNRAEVDETIKLLTPEELKQVRFFWLSWEK